MYVQNVNGLSLDQRGGQLNDVSQVVQETQADIFCGQEHNLDVTKMRVRSTLYDTVQQYWDNTKLSRAPRQFHSLPNINLAVRCY